MEKPTDIGLLLDRYLNNTASAEEVRVLIAHFREEGKTQEEVLRLMQRQVARELKPEDGVSPEVDRVLAASLERIKQRMHRQAPPPVYVPVRRLTLRRAIAVAACVLLMLTAGVGWYYHGAKRAGGETLAGAYGGDVQAGGDRATLTLSDGRVVELSSAKKGVVVAGGLKYNDGTALTDVDGGGELDGATELTLTTPRGGQYQTTLADGTRVWLNAGSSLRYPVHFRADKRVVVLEGEAFFDVSHDASRPFTVQVNGTEIQVLGTQFNVNAFGNVTATLVKGSVKIANNTGEQLLKPGQEARVGDSIAVYAADLDKVMAWKNGYFHFKDDHMAEIMAQLSRWYDVDVVYKGKRPDMKGYNGRIRRGVNLSSVLEMLTYVSGAKFEVQDRQVTVTIK